MSNVIAAGTKNFLFWLPFLGTSKSKVPLPTTSVTAHKLPWVVASRERMAHNFIMRDFWWLVLGYLFTVMLFRCCRNRS